MRGQRTGQKSVTVVSPTARVHPPEVNQICSPSEVANLSRTSSILRVCEGGRAVKLDRFLVGSTTHARKQALNNQLHRHTVLVGCCRTKIARQAHREGWEGDGREVW